MSSETTRKRYWARSLLGYSPFSNAQPNLGHVALASLEKKGFIGVELEDFQDLCCHSEILNDRSSFETSLSYSGGGGISDVYESKGVKWKLSTITQNVDTLHSKAGSKHVLHLHGRGDIVRCMNCGMTRDRKDYHDQLWEWNTEWMTEAIAGMANKEKDNNVEKIVLHPDGDAEWNGGSYDGLVLPPCSLCGASSNVSVMDGHSHHQHQANNETANSLKRCSNVINNNDSKNQQSFFKTDVVFFGDSIPKHRVHLSNAAIDAADGLLCIGTSLAVHSAFRLARRAIDRGIPVAILNVGETRIEREGLGIVDEAEETTSLVTKVESPVGETLAELVKLLEKDERQ